MKPLLKINFTDFWDDFEKTTNFFYKLLSQQYTLEISDSPDFLFYSCYGNEYLQYKCIRIFYASENMRPDFLRCDYALTFDFINRPNHYRLPLYHLYIDKHNYYDKLTKLINKEEAVRIWQEKKKFCCMLVSNPHAKERIDFFNALSKVKQVDSGGRHLNNIGFAVEDKMSFIKDYKFVFAFENSAYPGYTTEKILEPLVTNCIPIYGGNPLIEKDFNKNCFVNANRFDNYDSLINAILEIEKNEDLAIAMLCEKKIANKEDDHLKVVSEVLQFLTAIINKKNKKLPVAKNKVLQGFIFSRKVLKKIENRFFKKV